MSNVEEKNPDLEKEVEKDTPIKKWLVNYVGEQFQESYEEHLKASKDSGEEPNEWDGSITVEMIVEVVSKEFPEFLMAIAEENWIRGYHQALTDVREGEKIYLEELNKRKEEDADEE